ncbi:TraX protein [Anaerosphaera aminiphila DSM 21120]|uniref:TraX protein n=1 Tax=Anaerosphaera aminiphila DSM 21120 TaxID=1120995 RepID=A0A1M5PVF1_9FIRM|nr:TraX family protein [Anaerosphaera aminiphila]SHH05263.1 TraX protein [Anaerosphaera aminiphila DSM 21120]
MEKSNKLEKYSKLPLSGFSLKIIGIILMVFDHIHQMFYFAGIPTWFTMLGRLVAPIFIFLSSEGMRYTHSRLKYIRNLAFGSIFMTFMTTILQRVLPSEEGVMLMNNIFGTMLSIAVCISVIDIIISGFKNSNWKNLIVGFLLLALVLIYNFTSMYLMAVPVVGIYIVLAIPSFFMVEGGPVFVILGIILYYCKGNKVLQITTIAAASIISTGFWASGFEFNSLFSENIQWMMIFSAIPIALYNGKEGKKMKKFFYVFYPAHIAVLYIISVMIFK